MIRPNAASRQSSSRQRESSVQKCGLGKCLQVAHEVRCQCPDPTGRCLLDRLTACSPRISLNDDAQEKAVRLQSRQALHDIQMNQLKAAASPMRRLNNHARADSSSPRTSGAFDARPKESDGHAVASPVKRVPILANFEEWMKMATDNVCCTLPSPACYFGANGSRKSMRQTRGTLL